MKRLILMFLMLIPLVFAADSEPPVITAFDVKPTAIGHLLITWTIDDDGGLDSYFLYKDDILLHSDLYLTGMHMTDFYQDSSFIVGRDYEFKLVVIDMANNSIQETIELSSDADDPEITSELNIVSNKKILKLTTDENAYCLFGYSPAEIDIILIEETAKKDHKVTLPLVTEGDNLVYIKCEDEFNNEMSSFVVLAFEYDLTDPTKIKDLNYTIQSGKVQLEWSVANDKNGIAQYNIYDDQDEIIDSTSATIWIDSDKERTRYYIAAVDKAGNEGGKTRIDVSQVIDDEEEIVVEEEEEEEEVVDEEEEETDEEKTSTIIKVTVISWIIFGILLICFIAWKVYESNTDRHGLRKYMTKRRRVRNFRVRFKL